MLDLKDRTAALLETRILMFLKRQTEPQSVTSIMLELGGRREYISCVLEDEFNRDLFKQVEGKYGGKKWTIRT